MSNINKLITEIEKWILNFHKNPNRTYTPAHLLKRVAELREIRKDFRKQYLNLLQKDKNLAVDLKEQFEQSYSVLDGILEANISKTLDKNLKDNEMATFDIATTLKVIPEFQGDPKNLNNFLNLIEFLYDDLKDATEKSKLIKFILKTRLAEKVKNKLSITQAPTDLVTLKKTLQDIFKSGKTPLKIQSELAKVSQGNRPVKDFADQIEDLVSQLNSMQIAEQGETHRGIIAKLNDQIGLNSFKNGLHENLKTTVFASNPKTLQEAVNTANEAESLGTARVFNYNSRRFNNVAQSRNRNSFPNRGFRQSGYQRFHYNNNNKNFSKDNRNNFGNNNNNRQNHQSRYNNNYRGNVNNRRGTVRVNILETGNELVPEESGEN